MTTTYAKEKHTITRILELFVAKEAEVFSGNGEASEDRKVLDMSAARCLVFSTVMEEPGITSREIERKLSMHAAYVSRHIKALSQYEKAGRRGLNLIETHVDPLDARRKCHFLTPAGRAFAERLVGTVAHKGDVKLDGEKTPETLRRQWIEGAPK